jgi:putative hydrolase of the HAD superfamily
MKDYITNLEPLLPIPSEMTPFLPHLKGVQAVIFDIYGTLIISASGDVDSLPFSQKTILKCLKETQIQVLLKNTESAASFLLKEYRSTIEAFHQKSRSKGVPFPEVDIIKVWKRVIQRSVDKNLIKKPEKTDYTKLAFIFELLNNPVYPMPLLRDTINTLSRYFKLGLISNAQFYTPLILNYFLNNTLTAPGNETVDFFEPELTIFSFKQHKAKPDKALYILAKERLKKFHIKPESVLYVGNDMLNDICPAKRVGFKTALFAGDKRSLRLRREKVKGIQPDTVLTELNQIQKVLI